MLNIVWNRIITRDPPPHLGVFDTFPYFAKIFLCGFLFGVTNKISRYIVSSLILLLHLNLKETFDKFLKFLNTNVSEILIFSLQEIDIKYSSAIKTPFQIFFVKFYYQMIDNNIYKTWSSVSNSSSSITFVQKKLHSKILLLFLFFL